MGRGRGVGWRHRTAYDAAIDGDRRSGLVELAHPIGGEANLSLRLQRMKRMHPRLRPCAKELSFVTDGDSNGVCYFLGTDRNRADFVNPQLTSRVTVSTSSPMGRFTNPKVLTSRVPVHTSYSEPEIDLRTGRYQSWWQIDLGKRIKLRPNYYSVRHDSSDEFMRNWELRGSTDGSHWTTLRTHENDGTINKPLQCASWPVPGVGARTREGEGE